MSVATKPTVDVSAAKVVKAEPPSTTEPQIPETVDSSQKPVDTTEATPTTNGSDHKSEQPTDSLEGVSEEDRVEIIRQSQSSSY